MASRHIQVVILMMAALCMASSMHLHDQITFNSSYSTVLNSTQRKFQAQLEDAVQKLKFISKTLKQVNPKQNFNVSALGPTILPFLNDLST